MRNMLFLGYDGVCYTGSCNLIFKDKSPQICRIRCLFCYSFFSFIYIYSSNLLVIKRLSRLLKVLL